MNRLGFAFFSLGLVITVFVLRLGGCWHVLHWCSLSFLTLAIGYYALGPKIFGKKSGTVAVWAKCILFPYLFVNWIVWHLIRIVSREHATDQVIPRLCIGRRLCAHELPEKVDYYLDLTAEFDEPKLIRQHPGYVCLPILDGDIPTMEALDHALEHVADGSVYIHCAQGHGRTALVTIALLFKNGHITSLSDGMELLRRVRPGIRLNGKQQKFLQKYIGKAA